MNDQEKDKGACPACGYPSDAGHAWNCPLDKKQREDKSPYTHDYSSISDPEVERVIVPHAAEGPNVHEISIPDKAFKMPVSFHIEGSDFYITGLKQDTNVGAIVSGNISADLVKIRHIELAKLLRGRGVGKALLADLEEQLKQHGVKTAYSVFAKPSTVEYLINNGYKIVPLESLTAEQQTRLDIDPADYDARVSDEDNFRSLAAEGIEFRKILLMKELSSTMSEAARIELREILSQKPYQEVSQEALAALVPERVHEIAKNPDNIEVRPLRIAEGEISVLVIEKDYPDELTDVKAWEQWKQDIEETLKAQAGKPMKMIPPASKGIDRLHARFRTEIEQGELSLNDRILMTTKLRLHPDNQQALYVGDFDGESHQGIGQDFYKNTLPTLAKNLGLRFIVGQNHTKNVSFFKETLGRYTASQLKPEFQEQLFPGQSKDQFFTIQFLYTEDIEKYVEKPASS